MQHKFVFLCALLLCVSGSASLVFAHGSSFSHEEVKDGYKIDIGYDEFIAAEESVRFDFAIYPENIEAVEGEVFTDVWVTLTKDNKIYFAGGINKPVFGSTGFTYAFPEEGEYKLSARFQNESDTVVATEFPLTIIPPLNEKEEQTPLFMTLAPATALGVIIGFALGFLIRNRKKI